MTCAGVGDDQQNWPSGVAIAQRSVPLAGLQARDEDTVGGQRKRIEGNDNENNKK